MRLDPQFVLAPDRSYPFYATWDGARPTKERILEALRRFPFAQANRDVAVPVLSATTDSSVTGVLYPLQPLHVENVLAELAALRAIDASVLDWPDNLGGRLARAYWDRTIRTGIDANRSFDSIGDGTKTALRWALALGALVLGVAVAVRS